MNLTPRELVFIKNSPWQHGFQKAVLNMGIVQTTTESVFLHQTSRYCASIHVNLSATWSLQLGRRMQIHFQYLLALLCSHSHGSCSSCDAVSEIATCRSVSLLLGSCFLQSKWRLRILITLQGRHRASNHYLISHLIIGFYLVKVCFENCKCLSRTGGFHGPVQL